VAFDRIADRYDATRALPPEAELQMLELVVPELRDRGRVLEVGVGTGRIARPLAGAGVAMAGVDLSEPMLRRLAANAGGAAPFPVTRADATQLPFADDSFGAALMVHVLHLIPGWATVLAELARVVRSGGAVVTPLGKFVPELREVLERFCAAAGIERPFPGLDHEDDVLIEAMSDLGATVRPLGPVATEMETSIERFIDMAADGTWSWTWGAEPDARAAAAEAIRPWARERFGDIETVRRFDTTHPWVAFHLS
jgi:ubiquinone/menaquinone biosynthesis C-methylase UbiE